MPLWLWIALGAGGLYLWSKSSGAAGSKYTINNPTAYYPTDPTASGVASVGALATGTVVYAISPKPVLSSDQSFEQIVGPNGNVWVSVSSLTPAT